jgi:hypothetical protein
MSHTYDVTAQFWAELVARSSGPLALRFFIQPVTASLLAIRDGYKDARDGRTPYFWTILHDPDRRTDRIYEGLIAVSRVLFLGIVMDEIYQIVVLKGFRPIQMIDIVILLAFVPYLLVRGPAQRIARRWMQRPSAPDRHQTLRPG